MNKSVVITAIITLIVGVAIGYALKEPALDSTLQAESDNKPLYYRDPMNPGITSPVPAKDSMGMDYVPVFAEGNEPVGNPGTVSIDPQTVQNIGVRTTHAELKTFSRSVKAVGRVDFNEQKIGRLHPKVEGWIEDIYVDRTGEQVEANQQLLSIYSPKLVSTQQEYLLALKNMQVLSKSPIADIREGARALASSARERLVLLDVPEHQIQELEKSQEIRKDLHIHSPVTGTVVRIGAREGQYVSPKTELYFIVDLKDVWVYADVYDYELPWIALDDAVTMTLASVPGKIFKGNVDYIYPYAEQTTRTTRVRMVFDNPDLLLRPDMFADIVIASQRQERAIVIPTEAIVRSGASPQVYIQREPGKFEPRVVSLGIEADGEISILEGLEAGEEVVTSAQFLVDSESKLKEATNKMLESMKPSSEVHLDHGSDSHDDIGSKPISNNPQMNMGEGGKVLNEAEIMTHDRAPEKGGLPENEADHQDHEGAH